MGLFHSFARQFDLLSLLYPRRCPGCRQIFSGPVEGSARPENLLCFACFARLNPLSSSDLSTLPAGLTSLASAYDYTGLPAAVIPAWKYQGRVEVEPLIAAMVRVAVARMEQSVPEIDLITAVPLTFRAYRRRGFNQAFRVAWMASASLRRQRPENLLVKVRETVHQATLDRRERLRNLAADTFAVPHPQSVRGRRVLLCDDVCTTGTTMTAVARSLLEAGAGEVHGLTIARVVSGASQ